MKAVNVLLAVVVSALLALLVLEGGLRLIGRGPQPSLNEFHPRLGWSKRPGTDVRRKSTEFDARFQVNEQGLRDDPMPDTKKPEGTFRVVCLGDSFTLGFTVAREDLFVDQIESWWRSQGRAVDVVNAGTEGYSTDQEALWLIENGAAFEPDLVLLFPYENDVYWNGQLRYERFPKPRFSPGGELETGELEDPGRREPHSALGKLFFPPARGAADAAHWFEPIEDGPSLHKDFAPLLREPPAFLADCIARTRGALIALVRECERLGARLVVAPIPAHSAIDPAYAEEVFKDLRMGGLATDLWSADLPVDLFLRTAADLGILALDARPALRAELEAGTELYYRHDWHLDPAGNRAFATFLERELDRLEVFPPSHAAQRPGRISVPASGRARIWPWVFLGLWLVAGTTYAYTYRREEKVAGSYAKVGAMLAAIFAIWLGGLALLDALPARVSQTLVLLFLTGVLGFVVYKLGRRVFTIGELLKAFVERGHWYLMPLVVVLVTVGSLLIVAASSPFVAPFIYTLF